MALRVEDVTKRFPGVLANNDINFDLEKGEIHALLGENGAGKTTLMNIIYGLYKPDDGKITINGEEVVLHDPNDAIRRGIGMVHQHFMLVPVMTVTENVMLGNEKTTTNFLHMLAPLDRKRIAREITQLADQHNLKVDPSAYVRDLPVGTQQRVEIIKALHRGAEILILDEPTAVLTPQEADELFDIMRSLTQKGKSIIFITHKLKEVLAIADRITVLRGGQVVGSAIPSETSEHELASMMVGRDVLLEVEKSEAMPGDVVLDVTDLIAEDDLGHQVVRGVSFEVRAGEILGVAGVQGNGQREMVEALTGLRRAVGGHITLLGENITRSQPRHITDIGSAHVPEDRHKHGLVLPFTVADNLVLNAYHVEPFSKQFFVNRAAIDANADRLVQEFDVRTPSIETPASSLSGGNQQKTIVARELSHATVKLLIVNQPTRGLDVGSIEFIHKRIVQARDNGVAVLLISAELDEIMGLADRIAVMYSGRIVATVPAEGADRNRLGLLMAGAEVSSEINTLM
ncbi:MAG: ABC transporter ATP-binding protein [Anaerolineae bacterium]|nr:ABC transporter ATP-binding protein [Anaerolineae bacterium]